MDPRYYPEQVERAAQGYWDEHKSFEAIEDAGREKFYCLSMFPYPSGRLHMGHVRNYTIGDVIARYQRMQGKNVLQPMGWDAFGLPAENAAIENKVPPARWTYENIDYMRVQLKRLGFGYDWVRELATCKPEYYRWEQWLFTRLFKKGLVYKKTAAVNWCASCQTVLANEQVVNGRCWRCDGVVERIEIPQWFMKISEYADELLAQLDCLEGWPERVVTMQRNWIGRSEGVEIVFAVKGRDDPLKVFTTRPDTLLGATYMAVAPEHPLAVAAAEQDPAVAKFIEHCRNIAVSEAVLETMEKVGIATAWQAVHPITGDKLPIWIANFVLMAYGEGAIMAVPAHDHRDHGFAKKYRLPIKQVIFPADGTDISIDEAAYIDPGVVKNSGVFDGLTSEQAFDAIADALEREQRGARQVHFRLRDWGVSRQRYWGAPIPIINCPKCGALPVPEDDLPVVLPENIAFDGVGSPLKKMPEFYQTQCPQCGGDAERETDTFDTFVESSWYYARYCSRDNGSAMLDERAAYWLPVDQYVGGIEHAILHLLYARFYHKLMRDEGLVDCDEPFTNLLTQGMVLKDGVKMSKSRGNTVDPQALIEQYGADTARLFITFASPPKQSLEWSDEAVAGANRFLRRLWSLAYEHKRSSQRVNAANAQPPLDLAAIALAQAEAYREVHSLLRQANYDFQKYQFNTVVSAGMKILNILSALSTHVAAADDRSDSMDVSVRIINEGLEILLKLLSPIVPHITHILWRELGFAGELLDAGWPQPDAKALARDTIEIVVQVNGKLRGRISVPAGADKERVEQIALADDNVARHVGEKQVKKVIVVPKRLINIVT
ncbi:MAG: leucine--tRNA ligase [Acidiferrobacterales bacterium]|nr:leucine--tRNA ligase [Gammaproteobacteria bacterium]